MSEILLGIKEYDADIDDSGQKNTLPPPPQDIVQHAPHKRPHPATALPP